jgi:predicted RNA-binding protein with RPS1 domain
MRAVTEPTEAAPEPPADAAAPAEAAASPAEAAAAPREKKVFKKKFVKKSFTVKDADIAVGNEYPGKVKRVQEYGCFVDFGARSDGLVHISELTNGFVESVGDVVTEGQDVQVWIKSIDAEKGRFSLTMKPPPSAEEMEAFSAQVGVAFGAFDITRLALELWVRVTAADVK